MPRQMRIEYDGTIYHLRCLGSELFKRGLLKQLQGHLGPNHSGQMRALAARALAEAIIGAELKRCRGRKPI